MAFFDTMETDREMRRRAELSDLHDAIRYLEAINRELVAALEVVEWAVQPNVRWPPGEAVCSVCWQRKQDGHKPDCQLSIALAKAKKR